METYGTHLRTDTLIRHHLDLLYDRMLEANLLKIIKPFSCVEISRIAELINLPLDRVERKLSQMILDGTFSGILDQGRGHLIVHEQQGEDRTFALGVDVVTNMGSVVDALFTRARSLLHTSATEKQEEASKDKEQEKEKEKGAKAENSGEKTAKK